MRDTVAMGYVRAERPERAASIFAAARARIEAEAVRRSWELIDVHEEIGSVGLVPPERPALTQVMDELRAGPAGVLIVDSLDHLTRSMVEAREITDRARSDGWAVCAAGALTTSKPVGDVVYEELATVLVDPS